MSEKLPQQPNNEEVDLGQLFNAIGRLFERLFAFIGSVFKGIFSAIIYVIKPLVDNFKIVVSVLVISAILGYIYEKSKDPIYFSEMVVKPHFDSKYQLATNIGYFNTLIGSQNYIELSNIFKIDTSDAKTLVSFELEAGPESQNDLFIEYDEYVQSVDTSLVDELSFIDYINNRDLMSSRLFAIKSKSTKIDIFPHLQKGFKETFENDFSGHQKKVRDTLAYIEQESLKMQLDRLDSIQKTYLEAIKNDSKNSNLSLGLGNVLPLQEEKTATKEFDLFLRELSLRRELSLLNKTVAEENTFYDILSPFDKIGKKDYSFKQRYSLLFPLILLVLFLFFFLFLKVFKFIKNYE
ncbi:hypothetical protein [Winogradskyella endarachnes]|uniref:Uncharacterized protein n=1 Tax=Winogradskyella endarachnes TaxID=2681965 RepID=A0A6L6U9T0_9FLAO|nr:hypothetical protein [Winogradskyella endarachnes]MUU79071.1 hypothetical protein [Winogradskyella endarachnes]